LSEATPPRDAWLAGDPPADPLPHLAAWIEDARRTPGIAEADAATLATVDPDGRPSARIVLLRALDTERGSAAFYTNRASRKGRALAAHPRAALVLYWDSLGRQARIEGPVTLTSDAESDAYFASRHPESRVAAAASDQSEAIDSRAELLARFDGVLQRFGAADAVPRPPGWGGYRIWIERLELWASRAHRLHDRIEWRRSLVPEGSGYRGGAWRARRLMP
jgi:pyridoxamine 5'-phosphate oxidase